MMDGSMAETNFFYSFCHCASPAYYFTFSSGIACGLREGIPNGGCVLNKDCWMLQASAGTDCHTGLFHSGLAVTYSVWLP
jgi:hypothetical protein